MKLSLLPIAALTPRFPDQTRPGIRFALSSTNLLKIHLGLFVFAGVLTACAARATEAPTALPPVVPSPTPESACTVISAEPTQEAASPYPPVSPADYVIGPADALVTIIEYCDFQAPICQSMAAVMSNVVNDHVEDVRFAFRPVPLIGQLDKTDLAVRAAIAADAQGRFWEMYDALFQKNDDWANLTLAGFEKWLNREAVAAGLDPDQFTADLHSDETATAAQANYDAAVSLGNLRLPFVLINGKPQPTFAMDHGSIDSAVGLILLSKRQFTECPPFTIEASKQYIATLHTEQGDIVIELLPDKAPLAVNSFVFLARQGWFDDITFHRIIPGFAAQTGDPSGTGRGNPGYLFQNEITDLRFDRPGVVGMANSGPDTNGSQFFITFAPASHLDGAFTIFGRVLSGMDVTEMLTPRDPEQLPSPPPGDKLLSVEIEER